MSWEKLQEKFQLSFQLEMQKTLPSVQPYSLIRKIGAISCKQRELKLLIRSEKIVNQPKLEAGEEIG